MNYAIIIRKRQTELGEYPGFEDEAFSSYGPITEYHGTAYAPEIDRGGLQGNVMSPHRAVRPPADMEGKPVVYTTTDKKLAQQWAEQQTKRMNKFGKEKRKPRVVAIRGQGLDYTPDPKQDAKSSFQQGEVRVRTPNIPRKRLVVRKHAESPEAKKHKKEYDTKYESTPKRKKYRAELTQERRKRGVAGKGGKDMSHTARGTIVPEDRHANRARHFKERGTLKKNLNRWFKEKWVDVSRTGKDGKHPPCGRSKAKKGSKGYPKCRPSVKVSSKTPKTSGSMSTGEKRAATKRKRSKKQGVGGKPTIVKEQKKLFQPGIRQTNLFNDQTALVPTDFAAEQKAREEAQRLAQDKEARRQAQMVKVREMKLKPLDKFGMLKMQMANAQMILKGECPTPHKGAYRSMQEAQEAAQYQSRQAGRPISAYRCVSMGGKGCGMFHLTSG